MVLKQLTVSVCSLLWSQPVGYAETTNRIDSWNRKKTHYWALLLQGPFLTKEVSKGAQYVEMVKPRLEALVRLKDILENDFRLFSYMPRIKNIFKIRENTIKTF